LLRDGRESHPKMPRSSRRRTLILAILLAGLVVIAARDAFGPHSGTVYLEAELARIDVAEGRIVVVRDGGSELSLPVEGAARAALPRLRPGMRGLLACRSGALDPAAPEAVLDLRITAAPPDPGPPLGAAALSEEMTAGLLGSVKVTSVDRQERLLGVVDETGTHYALPVRTDAAYGLRSVRPGDRVALTLGPGSLPTGGLCPSVIGIERLRGRSR